MRIFTQFRTYLLQKKRIVICLLPGLLAFSGTIAVQAADFKHTHSDSCYSYGMAPCNAQHQSGTRTDTTTAHCSRCGTSTTQTMTVNWYHCFGDGSDCELGGKRRCNQCGNQTYEWGGSSTGTHEIYRQILSCGKDGQSTGSLWLRNNTPGWTSGEVTLEAGVRVLDGTLRLPASPYSWNTQENWTGETRRQVSENGKYTVYARNAAGEVVSEAVTVKNIDRTAPILSNVERSEEEWTNQDVTLTLFPSDQQPDGSKGCGMAELPISYDGGSSYTQDNMLTVSGNGSFEVCLSDRLGNIGYANVTVSNIDKCGPVITGILAQQEGWQREEVTMQAGAYDPEGGIGMHENSFSLDQENWQAEPEFTFTENGEYRLWARDALGNETNQDFVVNRIDRTAPVIQELLPVKEKTEQEKIFVTIEAADLQPDGSEGCGLHERAYSLDGGKSWQKENGFWVKEGERYDIRVRDSLLWESKERIVERKDFPYPPKEEDGGPENTEDPPVTSGDDEPEEEKTEEEKQIEDTPSPEPPEEDGRERKSLLRKKPATQKMDTTEEVIPENLAEEETELHIMKLPWYKTAVGKVAVIGAGILTALGLAVFVLLLFLRSVPVFCVEAAKETKLGRVLLHRSPEGYSVYLPEFMLEAAVTAQYRIKVSLFLLKWVENTRLLVESDEKNVEVLMQETIDFAL